MASLTRSPPRQRGLSLIELLVAIVILGFVIGIMSSAFTQVSHILRVTNESDNGFQERWLRVRALQDLVGNLVAGENPASWLTGTADSFECTTLASPLSAARGAQRVRVQLEHTMSGVDSATTQLMVRNAPPTLDTEQKDTAVRWSRWPGDLRFAYIDRLGTEHAAWPPQGSQGDELPSEVLLRPTQDDKVLVRTAVFEGPLVKPATADAGAMRDFLGLGH